MTKIEDKLRNDVYIFSRNNRTIASYWNEFS